MNTPQTQSSVGSGHLVLLRVPGKLYDTGKHRWAHGTPIGARSWNGIPEYRLLGPCPTCGFVTSSYGCGWVCNDHNCQNSIENLVCNNGPLPDWWETNVNVFLDGAAWCATLDGFVNLQESVAGFGKTPRDAVAGLLLNLRKRRAEPATPGLRTDNPLTEQVFGGPARYDGGKLGATPPPGWAGDPISKQEGAT